MGAAYVREKTGKALDLYNRILPEFCHYENKCLYDTFVKGYQNFSSGMIFNLNRKIQF